MTIIRYGRSHLILVTTGGGVLFQAGALFSIENANFWPVSVILSQIYTFFGALFTGLNSAVVPQN